MLNPWTAVLRCEHHQDVAVDVAVLRLTNISYLLIHQASQNLGTSQISLWNYAKKFFYSLQLLLVVWS